MNKIRCTNHPLNMLLPKQLNKCCEYELRDKSEEINVYESMNFVIHRDHKNFSHSNTFNIISISIIILSILNSILNSFY